MRTYQISPMNEAEAELLAAIEQALTNFRVTTGKIVRSVKVVGHSQYGTEVAIRADVSDRLACEVK